MTTTIIPDAGSTFLPLQPAATLTPSVDWGLVRNRRDAVFDISMTSPNCDIIMARGDVLCRITVGQVLSAVASIAFRQPRIILDDQQGVVILLK